MARRIPEDRFSRLVRAATGVFLAQGYRRTQMADVADALGVAKGTLYLYVESKAALFWLCALHCDAPEAIERPDPLPVPTPADGEIARLLRTRLAGEARLPKLTAALTDEQKTILEQRGVLEPAEIHRLASKAKPSNTDEKVPACHSDQATAEQAQEIQKQSGVDKLVPLDTSEVTNIPNHDSII